MHIMKTSLWVAAVAALFFTPAIAASVSYTVSSGGKPVLALKLPAGCEARTKGDKTIIADWHQRPKFEFELWVVENRKTVNEVVERIGDIIKSEFQNIKVNKTDTIRIADVQASKISGAGAEADDGDPGKTQVVVFSIGGPVFVACVHGEGDYASRHLRAMLDVLDSAQKP